MKQILKFTVCILLMVIIFFVSCKKELSCENCKDNNKPPIANAGADQTIALPKDSVLLDGSASTDPDNNITAYAWTKVSGPSSLNIVNANGTQTQVTGLVQGVYQFELKVTDAGGLFSRDTIQVAVNSANVIISCGDTNRPQINIQLTPFGKLSITRNQITVATAGNKILFAGGRLTSGASISRVDIFDFTTQNWSTAELSTPRTLMSAGSIGNKIFFAGGGVPGFWGTTRVDIYDASTNTLSVAELPSRTALVSLAAAGTKMFFAGDGVPYGDINIYDVAANSWSTKTLPEPRIHTNATAAGNKIYFAGGNKFTGGNSFPVTSTIDIYDNVTDRWTVSSLVQPTTGMSSITLSFGKLVV